MKIRKLGQGKAKIAIVAGQHGDEINGIEVVRGFLRSIRPEAWLGGLLAVPLINESGYEAGIREVPEDGKDLNRQFLGNKQGSASQRLAYEVTKKVIRPVEAVVDVHDAGQEHVLLPHVRIHGKLDKCLDGCTVEMGAKFGTDILLLREGQAGMLAIESFQKLGKPVLTVEIGGQGKLWPEYIKAGVRGLHNMLVSFGLVEGRIKLPRYQYVLQTREGYVAKLAGNLTSRIRLGQEVRKGEVIAEISGEGRKKEQVISDQTGVVFSLNTREQVKAGDSVASILAYDCGFEKNADHLHCHFVKVIENQESEEVEIVPSQVFDNKASRFVKLR